MCQLSGQKKRRLLRHEDWLHEVVASEADITPAELQKQLAEQGVEISPQAINTTLRALGGGGSGAESRLPMRLRLSSWAAFSNCSLSSKVATI